MNSWTECESLTWSHELVVPLSAPSKYQWTPTPGGKVPALVQEQWMSYGLAPPFVSEHEIVGTGSVGTGVGGAVGLGVGTGVGLGVGAG
ncbi:MAG: hypothetical protein ACHQ01_10275, partial [Candidatus Limnocylindrales bacterium]